MNHGSIQRTAQSICDRAGATLRRLRTWKRQGMLALAASFLAISGSILAAAPPVSPPAGFEILPSGLAYRVEQRAQSQGAHPTADDIVRVLVKGTLLNGDVFWETDGPTDIRLSRTIAGWREGLPLMAPGDVFTFWIPPGLAYGEKGFSTSIPAKSTIIFRITLLEIVEKPKPEPSPSPS